MFAFDYRVCVCVFGGGSLLCYGLPSLLPVVCSCITCCVRTAAHTATTREAQSRCLALSFAPACVVCAACVRSVG